MDVHAAVRGSPDGLRYLWLRTVTGFDPRKHCAACLRGKRLPDVHLGMADAAFAITTDAPYLYLCAGSNRGYDFNAHLAMRVTGDACDVASVETHGARFTFRGAVEVPIPALPAGFAGLPGAFTTCRNFRFGVAVFRAALACGTLAA